MPIYAGSDGGGSAARQHRRRGGRAGRLGIPAEDALGAASWRAREWLGWNAASTRARPPTSWSTTRPAGRPVGAAHARAGSCCGAASSADGRPVAGRCWSGRRLRRAADVPGDDQVVARPIVADGPRRYDACRRRCRRTERAGSTAAGPIRIVALPPPTRRVVERDVAVAGVEPRRPPSTRRSVELAGDAAQLDRRRPRAVGAPSRRRRPSVLTSGCAPRRPGARPWTGPTSREDDVLLGERRAAPRTGADAALDLVPSTISSRARRRTTAHRGRGWRRCGTAYGGWSCAYGGWCDRTAAGLPAGWRGGSACMLRERADSGGRRGCQRDRCSISARRRPVWQNVALSPARPDPLIRTRAAPIEEPDPVPTRCAAPHHTQLSRRHHRRGRQDPFEAPGQDPGAAVPHRRRRLAQEARRSR